MVAKKTGPGRTTAKAQADGVEMTMDEILGGKRATTEPLPICLDSNLTHRVDELEKEVRDASVQVRVTPDDGEAADRLEALQAELEEAKEAKRQRTALFVFRALGRKELEDLERLHKVTKEQISDYRDQCRVMQTPPNNPPNYNFESFPPALISASAIKPEISLEQAIEMWNSPEFSKGELGAIFQHAWSVNNLVR